MGKSELELRKNTFDTGKGFCTGNFTGRALEIHFA